MRFYMNVDGKLSNSVCLENILSFLFLFFLLTRYFLSLTMKISYFGEIKVEMGFADKPREQLYSGIRLYKNWLFGFSLPCTVAKNYYLKF